LSIGRRRDERGGCVKAKQHGNITLS